MSGTTLTFTLDADGTRTERPITLAAAVIAAGPAGQGGAGKAHRELEELGVPRPASTPIYYRVSAARFTTAESIECTGPDSSARWSS